MAGAPDEARLWELCVAFIREHNIHCEETIYQSDAVYIDAPHLVEAICEIVGYDR